MAVIRFPAMPKWHSPRGRKLIDHFFLYVADLQRIADVLTYSAAAYGFTDSQIADSMAGR